MPGDAFPTVSCCARAFQTGGQEHASSCTGSRQGRIDALFPAERSARAAAERAVPFEGSTSADLRARLEPVPGPPPGVEGSFVGEAPAAAPLEEVRVPQWAVHVFPTTWPDGHDAEGLAVIPMGAQVLEVRGWPTVGGGLALVVLCDSEPSGQAFPRTRAIAPHGWQALTLRLPLTRGDPVASGHVPPRLLGLLSSTPLFATRTHVLSALEVDEARERAGHTL